jgi:hypothetical protein
MARSLFSIKSLNGRETIVKYNEGTLCTTYFGSQTAEEALHLSTFTVGQHPIAVNAKAILSQVIVGVDEQPVDVLRPIVQLPVGGEFVGFGSFRNVARRWTVVAERSQSSSSGRHLEKSNKEILRFFSLFSFGAHLIANIKFSHFKFCFVVRQIQSVN